MDHNKFTRRINHILFIGPSLITFIVIVIVPLLMGIYYSMTSWNGISQDVNWVGIENFITIFTTDERFLHSIIFTAKFTLVAVIASNLIGFLLALILSMELKSRNILRSAFFLPNMIGGLILGFIWYFIFVQGLPPIGKFLGLSSIDHPWLGDPLTAFYGIVIVYTWQVSGYLMVIYIAAIVSIDTSLMEAARMDGASRAQVLRHIILPLIMPAFTICLFLTLSSAFKIFDINMSLTGGGPFYSTQSVSLNIYHEAYQANNFGLGVAKSLILFLIVTVITSVQLYFTKRNEVQY